MSAVDRTGCRSLVVLAAGMGRRFQGCKQLTAVGPGGETIMEYLVHQAWVAGLARVVVVTRPELVAEVTERLDRRFSRQGGGASPTVEVVEQPTGLRGTVPAVLAARRALLGVDRFAVANADDLYPLAALRAIARWDGAGLAVAGFRLAQTLLPGSGTVNRALCRTRAPSGPSGARTAELQLVALAEAAITRQAPAPNGPNDHWVARYLGMTKGEEFSVPGTHLVSMNLWALRSTIWPIFEEAVGVGQLPAESAAESAEVLLPVVIGELVAQGRARVHVLPIEGRCVGLTWPEELAPVKALAAEMVAVGDLPATAALQGTGPS